MNKILSIFMLILGLFFIFWAISFYYYNPTVALVGTPEITDPKLKFQIAIIFFWSMLILGLGLAIISIINIYKLMFKKSK